MTSNEETRLGISHKTDSYSGATGYGSGTTGGAGIGNKTNLAGNVDTSDVRLDAATSTDSYRNATGYGSGTTGGAGIGNKITPGHDKQDSTMGKLMGKVGEMVGNEGMVKKGHEKREAAGYSQS